MGLLTLAARVRAADIRSVQVCYTAWGRGTRFRFSSESWQIPPVPVVDDTIMIALDAPRRQRYQPGPPRPGSGNSESESHRSEAFQVI